MRLSNIALAIAALPHGAYPAYQPTLNLDFINEVYEIFEYGPLDASLNLDFVYQIYQSE